MACRGLTDSEVFCDTVRLIAQRQAPPKQKHDGYTANFVSPSHIQTHTPKLIQRPTAWLRLTGPNLQEQIVTVTDQ